MFDCKLLSSQETHRNESMLSEKTLSWEFQKVQDHFCRQSVSRAICDQSRAIFRKIKSNIFLNFTFLSSGEELLYICKYVCLSPKNRSFSYSTLGGQEVMGRFKCHKELQINFVHTIYYKSYSNENTFQIVILLFQNYKGWQVKKKFIIKARFCQPQAG